MDFAAPAIHRPIGTILITAAAMVAGIAAYFQLPVAALPSYNTPTLSVSANLPGASPDTMATSVATPLEKQFSTIGGLSSMSSSSTAGSTSITLEFNPDRDIDAAAVDVQAALLRAQRSLPAEMTSLPSYRKVNPADAPILLLALDSPTLPLTAVNAYADNWVSPALSTLDGVAQVQIYGQKRYAVRVTIDPARLAAQNLSLEDVAQALKTANATSALGSLETPAQTFTLQANAQLRTADEFAQLIVGGQADQPVRLGAVAKVEDSVENLRAASWVNGTRAIVLAVMRQPNANTVAVVDGIYQALPRLNAQLPGAIRLRTLNDRSESIRGSVHDVQFTLGLTILLVVMVIALFLRRATAVFIPAITLPISLLFTVALMLPLGLSINNVSLLAMTLAVGLVVDDAIVMLENIVRHLERGATPLQAALIGSREVAFTIISISISLVAVFIPLFFMPGVMGLLFHDFAVVVSLAVLVSAVVSLTLVPMLASRLLGEHPATPPTVGRLGAVIAKGLAGLDRLYIAVLDACLKYRRSVLVVAVLTFVASGWLFMRIPKGFFPIEDTGQISVNVEARQDISAPALQGLLQQVSDQIQADPAVLTVTSAMGFGGNNTARLFIALKPKSARGKLESVLIRLRKTAWVVGANVFFTPVQNLRLGGRSSKSQFQYTLSSVRADALSDWADKLVIALRNEAAFRDVTSDAELRGLQAELKLDRDKVALLGLDMGSIRNAIYSAYGGRQAASIYTASEVFPVMLDVSSDFKTQAADLLRLSVRNKAGVLIPLSSVAIVQRTVGPSAVNHQGQLQAVTVSFNLAPGVALSAAAAQIKTVSQTIQLPDTIIGSFSGDAAAFQQSQSAQIGLLVLALVVIYILLGVLYESFVHPLTILAGLPSAAIGALLALQLFGMELTIIATIGILLLMGIVKKNAIMMIDFALEAQRTRHLSAFDAIREACILRFRPIMMTTLAALMGAVPLAFAYGSGAELRQPLGLAVVGGLLFSQLITLFITPVLFLALARWDTPRAHSEHVA